MLYVDKLEEISWSKIQNSCLLKHSLIIFHQHYFIHRLHTNFTSPAWAITSKQSSINSIPLLITWCVYVYNITCHSHAHQHVKWSEVNSRDFHRSDCWRREPVEWCSARYPWGTRLAEKCRDRRRASDCCPAHRQNRIRVQSFSCTIWWYVWTKWMIWNGCFIIIIIIIAFFF